MVVVGEEKKNGSWVVPRVFTTGAVGDLGTGVGRNSRVSLWDANFSSVCRQRYLLGSRKEPAIYEQNSHVLHGHPDKTATPLPGHVW